MEHLDQPGVLLHKRKEARFMSDPRDPSPKRKSRAGLVVVGLVLAIAVVIFIGMNIDHAKQMEEQESTTQSE
jgi:hypothetical protein